MLLDLIKGDGVGIFVAHPSAESRHGAGVANKAVAVAHQYMRASVGVVGVVVAEAVTERPVPQPPQRRSRPGVELVALDDDEIHDRQPRRRVRPRGKFEGSAATRS